MKRLMNVVLATVLASTCASATAAIALDRTRAVFPGSEKSLALNISNENKSQPYLAQAWLENEQGQKITSPLIVVPPMQRVEPGQKSVIRINKLPAALSLPQDRESVFWLNVREVPPRSERNNVLQVALQTKIKVFYRPAAIMPEKFSRWDDQLILHPTAEGFNVENPTPYYMTVIAITAFDNDKINKDFKPVMIAPKSTALVKSKVSATPNVTTINDFGGRPKTTYHCKNDVCTSTPKR